MTRYNYLLAAFLLLCGGNVAAQQLIEEPLPFGDMNQWITRTVKESAIIGGNSKNVYEIAPTDAYQSNKPYYNQGGSPWATSNVMAKVVGIVKTNTSVFPEERGDGKCARMETRIEKVRVFGLIDITVLAAGSVFLGAVHEPISGTSNPQKMLNSGIPFTKMPSALCLDYKVNIVDSPERVKITGFSPKSKVAGKDNAAIVLLLQKRWEDKDGNIYASRVGTHITRFDTSSDWQNKQVLPIQYGDISKQSTFKPYMGLQAEERYAVNSRGESVPIKEIRWASPEEVPTHMILQFTSSHGGAYIGTVGNTLWVDNVCLQYIK